MTATVPDFKIRVLSKAHSRAIQEELFERGVQWNNGAKTVSHTDADEMFCESGRITYSKDDPRYFQDSAKPEHTFANGKFSFDKEEVKPDADGGVEWTGGECPLANGVEFEFKMRSGKTSDSDYAALLRWNHTGTAGDIIAYRACKPKSDSTSIPAQEQPTLGPKKEWQQARLLDVLKEMTRLVGQSDYDTVYDLLTDEAAPLVNDLKWK